MNDDHLKRKREEVEDGLVSSVVSSETMLHRHLTVFRFLRLGRTSIGLMLCRMPPWKHPRLHLFTLPLRPAAAYLSSQMEMALPEARKK